MPSYNKATRLRIREMGVWKIANPLSSTVAKVVEAPGLIASTMALKTCYRWIGYVSDATDRGY